MATLRNNDVWLFSELPISMQDCYSKRFIRFINIYKIKFLHPVRYSQRIESDVNSSD